MRIGILSDTHNQVRRTETAIARLQAAGAEVLFHCGDFTGPQVLLACAKMPCYFVFGNNDADMVGVLQRAGKEAGAVGLGWGGEVLLAEKRIAVTHGHLPIDVRPLLAAEPDYLLSGHSHIAHDMPSGVTRRINPGALHRAKNFTVALLDLTTDELTFLAIPR